MLATAVFELVRQFVHATEIGKQCRQCGQRFRWSALGDKIKTLFRIKWTIAEHNLR